MCGELVLELDLAREPINDDPRMTDPSKETVESRCLPRQNGGLENGGTPPKMGGRACILREHHCDYGLTIVANLSVTRGVWKKYEIQLIYDPQVNT